VDIAKSLFARSLCGLMVAATMLSAAQVSARVPAVEEAPIALLVDLNSGQVLQEREANRRFLPASITKVMTVFTAFELMAEGKLSPKQTFTIRPDTHEEWYRKGSTMFLPADAQVDVEDLLMGITTVSANDASMVLAEGARGSVDAWIALMNQKAREIGMANSHFGTPNGWPDEGKTFVTARDLAVLAETMIERHAVKYEHYFGHSDYRYGDYAQSNHDPLVGRVEGADGIKTGFTNEAGYGFLGSAQRDGRRLVMVVGGARSEEARAQISRDFIEWGFSSFASRQLYAAGDEVGTARVQAGSMSEVGLIAAKPVQLSVLRGTDPEVKLVIRYDGPLRAPIAAGEEVAVLEMSVEGMPTSSLPLLAAEAVETASPLRRVIDGIAGWF
jgi:D-alanyl-D-alanine carboxypeptidase (penicillin-binding protein 5/6)